MFATDKNPHHHLVQLNDGSLLFRDVDRYSQGVYLCGRSGRLSKRINLIVAFMNAHSGSLLRPLILLFCVVVFAISLVVFMVRVVMCPTKSKRSCTRRPKQIKAQLQPQLSAPSIHPPARLTSSPKDYEYYSQRWYSENCTINNYALANPSVVVDCTTSNSEVPESYYTLNRGHMHLGFHAGHQQFRQNLHKQQRSLFMSTRSARSSASAASKSCSRMSTR